MSLNEQLNITTYLHGKNTNPNEIRVIVKMLSKWAEQSSFMVKIFGEECTYSHGFWSFSNLVKMEEMVLEMYF